MILTSGCSWTYGLGVEPHETYAAYLQDYYNTPVINAGWPGTDIEFSIQMCFQLFKKYKPEIVILQLTTLDRITLSLDGKSNFLKQVYTEGSKKPILDLNCKYPRFEYLPYDLDTITIGTYTESLSRKTTKDEVVKLLMENYVYSNYKQEKIIVQLEMLKNYIQSNNSRIIFFNWLRDFDSYRYFKDHGIIPQSQPVASEFIGNDYYIDKGFHISPQGNKKLALDFLAEIIR